jgi:hypothetical protein
MSILAMLQAKDRGGEAIYPYTSYVSLEFYHRRQSTVHGANTSASYGLPVNETQSRNIARHPPRSCSPEIHRGNGVAPLIEHEKRPSRGARLGVAGMTPNPIWPRFQENTILMNGNNMRTLRLIADLGDCLSHDGGRGANIQRRNPRRIDQNQKHDIKGRKVLIRKGEALNLVMLQPLAFGISEKKVKCGGRTFAAGDNLSNAMSRGQGDPRRDQERCTVFAVSVTGGVQPTDSL